MNTKDELAEVFRAGVGVRRHRFDPPPVGHFVAPADYAIFYRDVPLWRSASDTLDGYRFGLAAIDVTGGRRHTLECVDNLGDWFSYGLMTLAGWREWLRDPRPLY